MQITTAAITTRQDGNVYNVFQVCLADAAHLGASTLST